MVGNEDQGKVYDKTSHICIRRNAASCYCVNTVRLLCLSQVNEAEEERLRSEREHMRVTHACQEAEARVQMLQKSLKRVIIKSKPYFELKAQFNHILEVTQTQRAQWDLLFRQLLFSVSHT